MGLRKLLVIAERLHNIIRGPFPIFSICYVSYIFAGIGVDKYIQIGLAKRDAATILLNKLEYLLNNRLYFRGRNICRQISSEFRIQSIRLLADFFNILC